MLTCRFLEGQTADSVAYKCADATKICNIADVSFNVLQININSRVVETRLQEL